MLKRISILIEYITWLYKRNLETQKSSNNIFRVIKTDKDENGDYVVDVQVINKSSVFRCSVKEITTRDQLLECFSKSDVRLITYLATIDSSKPKNKIIGFEYNNQTDRTIFQIKEKDSDHIIKITADKISTDTELLNNLSQEDALRAGYFMAHEQLILEKKAIEEFNKSALAS